MESVRRPEVLPGIGGRVTQRQYYLDNIYIEDGNLYCDDPVQGRLDLGPAPNAESPDERHFVHIQPLWWAQKACRLAPCGGAFAMCLWLQKGLQRSMTFRLTPTMREAFGISKQTSIRLLRTFEDAGLISVERSTTHSPTITILLKKPDREGES